jgi:hypothetical protein
MLPRALMDFRAAAAGGQPKTNELHHSGFAGAAFPGTASEKA